MKVTSDELHDDTIGVLRRAARGELLQVTIDGQPVAVLGPVSSGGPHWTESVRLVARLARIQADAALRDELHVLVGSTDEPGPLE